MCGLLRNGNGGLYGCPQSTRSAYCLVTGSTRMAACGGRPARDELLLRRGWRNTKDQRGICMSSIAPPGPPAGWYSKPDGTKQAQRRPSVAAWLARQALAWTLPLLVVVAIAAAGFLAGRSGGADLASTRAGATGQGITQGSQDGSRIGYRIGYSASYRAAYPSGYERAYHRAFVMAAR